MTYNEKECGDKLNIKIVVYIFGNICMTYLSKRRLLLMKEAMQITKWVALACSSGPDNSLQYSNCFVLDDNKRRTLKHTSGVLDDQKCFDGHGFSKKFMCSIYSSIA